VYGHEVPSRDGMSSVRINPTKRIEQLIITVCAVQRAWRCSKRIEYLSEASDIDYKIFSYYFCRCAPIEKS